MEPLLTADEAAAYLKLSPATLREWARLGKVQAQKFGKRWRFRRVDLDAIGETPPQIGSRPFDRRRLQTGPEVVWRERVARARAEIQQQWRKVEIAQREREIRSGQGGQTKEPRTGRGSSGDRNDLD